MKSRSIHMNCCRPVILLLLVLACGALSAQTFTISYQTPNQLVVCDADTLFMGIKNNTGGPVAGAKLEVELPAGLEYVPGSIFGAIEFNIGNPQLPVFNLPNLGIGMTASPRILVRATCAGIDAINNGQLFSLKIRVKAGAVTEQTNTPAFLVETGLLVITDVVEDSLAGEKGQVLTRIIHVKNTRLGPVRHLRLRDAHQGGISVEALGATSQQTQGNELTAFFNSTYFTNFGDGDAVLEIGETAFITEKITVTDCGYPAFRSRSQLSVAWGCTSAAPACQADSTRADVHILPSTYLPNLVVESRYGYPLEQCGQTPVPQRLFFINKGPAPATNVLVQLQSLAPEQLGMGKNTFQFLLNGQTINLAPTLSTDEIMDDCGGVTRQRSVTVTLPQVPANDTVELRFNAFFCGKPCTQTLSAIQGTFFHTKPCPVGGTVSENFLLAPEGPAPDLQSQVAIDIGDCLEDQTTYTLHYRLRSDRLTASTGFLRLRLDLPWGLFWDNSCLPLAAGQSPVQLLADTLVTTDTIVRVEVAYALPLPDDSLSIDFCLLNTCRPDASYTSLGNQSQPDVNGNFFIVGKCSNCGYVIQTQAALSTSLSADVNCAVSRCDDFTLRTNCDCGDDDDGGGTPVVPSPFGECSQCVTKGPQPLHSFHAYRLNRGLNDLDNNRRVDPGAPDSTKLRLDRFLPGDTMRVLIGTRVLADSTCELKYTIFTEAVRSAIPHGGANDTFDIKTARSFFANPDRFRLVRTHVRVWDADVQQAYTCFTNLPVSKKGNHYGIVTSVNTDPPEEIDELVSMRHILSLSTDSLTASGCFPDCFALEAGDSITLTVDFKLDFNFVPPSAPNHPPLINFEMGFSGSASTKYYNYRQFDTLMFQYSGFRDTLAPNTHGIQACGPSNEIKPFYYVMRLARPNLFPYEVRPLSAIEKYELLMPSGLTPSSVDLKYLRLQGNVPLLNNLPLAYTVQDTVLDIDFAPVFAEPVDEGFRLETKLTFEPNCRFLLPHSSRQRITINYTDGLYQPDPELRVVYNNIGFFSNVAYDTLTTPETTLEFPGSQVEASLLLKNLAPVAAPHAWMRLVAPDGGLADFELLQLPQNTSIAATNGIYQLGALGIVGQKPLKVRANKQTCDPQRLWVIYGWDCQPYTVPGAPSCNVDTLEILFIPQNPELELKLVQMPANAPLCDASDYVVVELFNADLGYAYDPFVNVELPPGIEMAPGSCQLAYPVGTMFQDVSDPINSGLNTWEWNLAALHPTIASVGLPGIDKAPLNTVQIRFKVQAGCGAISNTQLVFGAKAVKPCGDPTNTLRKASDPLLVGGLAPSYTVQVSLMEPVDPGLLKCREQRTLVANLVLSGPAQPGDSIMIVLPPGFGYVPGSYQPGINAPAGPPQVQSPYLRLPLPPGLPAGANVQFTFRVLSPSQPECDGTTLQLYVRQRTSAYCPSAGADCAVYVAAGTASYTFVPLNPELFITGASVEVMQGGNAVFQVQLTNKDSLNSPPPVIHFYRDVDGNGLFSPGDTLLGTASAGSIAPDDSSTVSLTRTPPSGGLCNIIAVLFAGENCDCENTVLPVKARSVLYAPQSVCQGASAPVGITAVPGHLYQWSSGAGLACDTCSQTSFLSGAAGLYHLTLTDQYGDCVVAHRYQVTVTPPPGIITPPPAICRGAAVTLQTSPAVSWSWQGPGLNNATAAKPTVAPTQTSLYYVTVTNAAGCTGLDTITVTVLPADSVYLGVVRTCAGTPVPVFGTLTETPGWHSRQYSNIHGCDSVAYLRLEVVAGTSEEMFRCPGETLTIFGQSVTAAGSYCQKFPSSLGCDSTHCIIVTDLPEIDLPPAETLYAAMGESVPLPAVPGDFADYYWSPAGTLSCSDCPNPTATPTADTTDYVLTVTTEKGCSASVTYRVVLFPPCDPARLQIPNAFTPDGDGTNDVFRVVPFEGTEEISYMAVFDRWGQKVYEGSGAGAAWNGEIDGAPAPSDVYVYLIEVTCSEGRGKLVGNVTVLR